MGLSRREVLLGGVAAIPALHTLNSATLFGDRVEAAEPRWSLPPQRPYRVIENTWIPMKDGTRLACRLWLPQGAETRPVPVVWEYLPYRLRDRMRERDERTAVNLAPYGVAFARVDIRGSGNSEGVLVDEYDNPELLDGLEVIAWFARQPWSNGSVGMRGISWGGINSLQTAAQAPPALKAIMPMGFVNNRFDDDARVLNLAHRDSLEHPAPLQPGQSHAVRLVLYPMAHRFKPGSRIRVALSEGLWPLLWPSPQVATLQLQLGTAHLQLPVRARPSHEAAFTIPVIQKPPARQNPLRQTGPDASGRITLAAERPTHSAAALDAQKGAQRIFEREKRSRIRRQLL